MTLGEILDRTAQLYRRNFLSFAGVAAVPTVVMLLSIIPAFAAIGFFGAAAKGVTPRNLTLSIIFVAVCAVGCVVAVAATVVSQAALIRAATAAHIGQRLTIRGALKSVWPRFWRYVGVMCFQGVLVILIPGAVAGGAVALLFLLARLGGGGIGPNAVAGFFTFLVVAAMAVVIVLRALGYSLAMPACVAEDQTAWNSIQRSTKLTKGTRGRIFLMFLLVWALSMVISMIGYIPMMAITAAVAVMGKGAQTSAVLLVIGQVINVLVNFALQTLITPVYMTALVLFYFDQRIRTEGYDIEWMMERAGLAGTPVVPSPPEIASGPTPNPGTING